MKVFVGTMEHGEGEFEACREAVAKQEGVEVFHLVVSHLPENVAHERLYTQWNQAKTSHDLFLKVDADTVLAHRGVIKAYADMFEANPRLTGIQAWLQDYMTDQKIYGLTCLRNTVIVSTAVDKLYCDRADTGHDIVLRGDELPKKLNPAGTHCSSPTDMQAFHYGFHRGKKNQHDIRNNVLSAWKRYGDKQRGMALLGFALSAQGPETTYYDTHDFKSAFNKALLDYDVLLESVTK